MESNLAPNSSQGLLDLGVELSTSDITAGKEFAIFVLVKNPFSKPVWIQEVNVSLPSELKRLDEKEIQQKIQSAEENQQKFAQQNRDERLKLQEKIDNLQNRVQELTVTIKTNTSLDANISATIETLERDIERFSRDLRNFELGESSVHISGSAMIGNVKIGSQSGSVHMDSGDGKQNQISVNRIEIYEPWLIHEQQTLARTVSLKSSLPANAALQPGSTAVYTVVLDVKRSLIFTPTKYRLQFYVNYSFDAIELGQINQQTELEGIFTNTIAHHISIRPSVYSVITGSIIGGAFGSTARLLQATTIPSTGSIIVSLVLSTILGGMSIIFMARKSDTQSFISVEDFWGGILIGFLVGYTGTSFFENLTGVTAF